MLRHHNTRVNSHQRWKQTLFRVCFHLCCELTTTMNVTEWQASWNSWSVILCHSGSLSLVCPLSCPSLVPVLSSRFQLPISGPSWGPRTPVRDQRHRVHHSSCHQAGPRTAEPQDGQAAQLLAITAFELGWDCQLLLRLCLPQWLNIPLRRLAYHVNICHRLKDSQSTNGKRSLSLIWPTDNCNDSFSLK